MMTRSLPLDGVRVLVPRGGDLGGRLAAAVTRGGGEAIIAPIIDFEEPADVQAMADACAELGAGAYDWVAITSATAVEVLVQHDARIPEGTRAAVVGPATRDAMEAAGYRVDFMPAGSFSAAAMVAEWPEPSAATGPDRVLLPQSAIAEPTLADGLNARGLSVTVVSAYRTTALAWADDIRHQLDSGEIGAVLLTSASVARAVARQGRPALSKTLPTGTIVACIGESTAAGARAAGLPVHTVAGQSTAEGLVDALSEHLNSTIRSPREH